MKHQCTSRHLQWKDDQKPKEFRTFVPLEAFTRYGSCEASTKKILKKTPWLKERSFLRFCKRLQDKRIIYRIVIHCGKENLTEAL